MDNHQLINADSGNHNYGTPSYITDLAKLVMGYIDLDPASSLQANKSVNANRILTKENDGLKYDWIADTLWMNHPFSDSENACKPNCTKKKCKLNGKRGYCITENIPGNPGWINKLVNEYNKGNVNQACCITFASTSENWFKPLKNYPICMIDGRVNYIDLNTGLEVKGVTKGSVITYFGDNLKSFIYYFKTIGDVMLPAKKYYKG
jgi:hypothetical protein